MDFFQAQDDARRSTRRLVKYFALAVLSLIFLTYLLVAMIVTEGKMDGSSEDHLLIFLGTAAVVGSVILLGSLFKILILRGGGRVVAESLGGRLLSYDSTDPTERKILNVVEEMAIASGTPVPPVYLMDDETAINAFAAGYTPGDAVVGVTRGCVERLSRDELQGVIAHEFSHILNGDMRLNIRLIGILHGILLIGLIGEIMLRSMGRSRRSSKNEGAGAVLAIGLGLFIIGYTGVFFGKIIKSAVSRQREYLADSSAVQFTRNPSGISGALKKIGGLHFDDHFGSQLDAPSASEMSHAYFSQGVVIHLQSLFATHPPLEDRIRKLEPNWDGEFLPSQLADERLAEEEAPPQPSAKEKLATVATAVAAATAIDAIGRPTAEHLEQATSLIDSIPTDVRDAAHAPYSARAVIYCLLLSTNEKVRREQLYQLSETGDEGIYELTKKLEPQVQALGVQARLPLIDMAIPSLRDLSLQQYSLFMSNLAHLIEMDGKVDLFEWCLQKILFHHLGPEFGHEKRKPVRHGSLTSVKTQCQVLISCLATNSTASNEEMQKAHQAACNELGLTFNLLPKDQCDLNELNKAIRELATLKPLLKPRVLKAALAAITQDEEFSIEEMELMRAIADTLDCPMPVYISK